MPRKNVATNTPPVQTVEPVPEPAPVKAKRKYTGPEKGSEGRKGTHGESEGRSVGQERARTFQVTR